MSIQSVRIIGQGCLGVLYGHHWTERLGPEKVKFIATEERIARYLKKRATVNGVQTRFDFVTPKEGEPCDLLIFAVKQPALAQAIEDAKAFVGADTIVISLLNGITSEQSIGAAYGASHVLPVIAQGQDAVLYDQVLNFKLLGQLLIGVPESDPSKADEVRRLREFFDRTDFPYTQVPDVERRLWSKWMLNVGVNQVVCAAEGKYGSIQAEGELRERMKAAMREAKAVALAEGIPLTEQDLEDYVALIDTMNPEGMPSMRQDGVAKRPTEVDMFAGTVIEKAKKHGIEVPVNQALYEEIRKMESEWK